MGERHGYRARWVLPITGAPIADGVVLVHDGAIDFVGPATDAPTVPVTDLGDAVLLPGLVNVHTHLELTALRHALEGLAFVPWIRTLITLRDRCLMAPADQVASAQVGIAEGLLRGITTMADTAARGDGVLEAMRTLGVRGVVYQEVFGPDPAAADDALAALEAQVRALQTAAGPLQRIGISPHAPYSVSRALYARVASLATAQHLPVAVHLAESAEESALVTAGEGAFARSWRTRGLDPAVSAARSPVALLAETGVLATRPLVIHAVRVDDADVALLASHDCAVAHCPISNARFGHGIAPLPAWRGAGLRIGIGTDSVASNNVMDVLGEARVAHLMASARALDAAALPAAEALALATAGGGRALGGWPGLGTLARGAPADLAAFPLDGLGALPLHDLADALVHGLVGTPARLTVVAGVPRVLDGALVDAHWLPAARARVAVLGSACAVARAAGP